ncbi:hypothetical protein QQS21_003268 [Conoideocrella luteorostrata]|uniref:Carrier domain-containing protein n=1 Tax=Conoideocrella luteorostrata TaxID=1105319 RepID=A0AAJ0CTL5_9HYPO|nr:hypothetical protein QQS21_003268 [Conoideocrella luteorostrata]
MDKSQRVSSLIPPTDLAIYPFEKPAEARTLVEILNSSISAHPTAIALDNGTSSLSYTELASRVASQVDQLRALDIGVGDRVGVRISSGTLDLYVSILAVLTAGAAYVPVDVDDPDERANIVWAEANVCAVLTDNGTITQYNAPMSPENPNQLPGPSDDAWIIFTSGSTGKPKGVAVSHGSAAAFVDAESGLFLPDNPLGPGDRVLASLSVAFDASCEEMWLAWRHGACLVPAPRSLVKTGADLGTFLTTQRITVVSTVPTLAALWPTDTLSRLRLLILGGEACSPGLATRLTQAVKSGVVWNTYGPTEATVVSCAAPLVAGQTAVRIGLPLAGWKLAVIGDDGNPVRWGEEGELVIGGAGMARYLDLEKDRAKFMPEPVLDGERAYRSGDLVRAEQDGLIFVRRNDEQIKLGGRRLELGEIDAALITLPGVSATASVIQRSETGTQLLVGYVVRKPNLNSAPGPGVSEQELLRLILPAALVPLIVTVDEIPVRTSGKVDRKALPWPPPLSSSQDKNTLPVNAATAWLAEQWRRVLGVPASENSHFFDLGGTSLGAAQLVSEIRQRCPTISVADVYEYPRLKDMAARVDDLSGTKHEERQVVPTPRWLVLAQAMILYIAHTLEGLRWITALSLSRKLFALRLGPDSWAGRYALPWWLVVLGWVLFISMPGRMLVTAGIVRLLTINISAGTSRRGGSVHLRLWAAERFITLGRITAIAGTQWCRRYARLLGCPVGPDAQLHALPPATGLASFGAGSVVEPEADVAGWWLDGDVLHVGFITIGEGARVGARCTLMPNTIVEPYASIQPGICYEGTARGPAVTPSTSEKPAGTKTGKPFWTGLRYTSSLLLLDLLPILMTLPIWGLTPALVHDYSDFRNICIGMIEMSLPGAVLGAVLYAVVVIVLVRLASIAIRPGEHSWHRSTAWASWLTHFLVMDTRVALFPIYASLLSPSWLRSLGARVGRNVEASTIVSIPSLLEVKDGAFLADDALLSPFEVNAGHVRLGPSSVGVKAFVGNSAMVDLEIAVPEAALIGVLSKAPTDMESGSSWLGRPPMSLPRRVEEPANQSRTFEPPKRLVLARGFIELCRIFPLVFSAVISTTLGLAILFMLNSFSIGWAVLASGGFLIAAGTAACVIAMLAKWLLTPRVLPGAQHPLWSSFVWRNELADTFTQSLAVPWLIRNCYGTPILSLWLRCQGAKVGRGVWLDSHLLPEAELVELEDSVTINRGSVLQTHLFHDRLMRLDTVSLKRGATLGPRAVTLPGTIIGCGSTIGPTSLVMRGEQIPSGTRWIGNPVRPWHQDPESASSSSDDELYSAP